MLSDWPRFLGPVEVDQTYIGGKETNKHADKKLRAGRGTIGKTAVVGMKDRQTNQVIAMSVKKTDKASLQSFVTDHTHEKAIVHTDEAPAYAGIDRRDAWVKHGAGEFVNGQARINGIEVLRAMFKRGYHGAYHQISPKHLDRYVSEFVARHNARDLDLTDRMKNTVMGMVGKGLRYQDLIEESAS